MENRLTPGLTRGIIDTHHHYFPPAFRDAFRIAVATPGQLDLKPAQVPKFEKMLDAWSPGAAIARMDANGVATAMLSISESSLFMRGDSETGRRMARESNEYGAKMANDYPGRFALLASLPLPDVRSSIEELDYALNVLKVDGFGLMTSYGNSWPGDDAFKEIFDEIDRHNTVVYFHPHTPQCCAHLTDYVQPSLLEFTQDTTRAALNLLFSGTLSRCKNTRFLFSHAGGHIPVLAGRINTYAAPNPDFTKLIPNGIDHELKKLYYDTASSAFRPTMGALLDYVPIEQVVFGSDYPFLAIEANVDGLKNVGLTSTQLEKIGRANALNLFPRLMKEQESGR